jgi:hypothetical protein
MRTELRALERELLPEIIRIALLDAAEQFAWEWRLAAIRGAPSPDDSYLKTLVRPPFNEHAAMSELAYGAARVSKRRSCSGYCSTGSSNRSDVLNKTKCNKKRHLIVLRLQAPSLAG